MPFHLHLPVARAKPLPKKQGGATADSLRAAAARLDQINSLATNSKIPRFKELFSSDEEDGNNAEGEGKKHPRADNSKRTSTHSKTTSKQRRTNSLTQTWATTGSNDTILPEKRKRERPKVLSFDEEREEIRPTNSQLKRPGTPKEKDNTFAFDAKSAYHNPFKKFKAARQKPSAELDKADPSQ